MTHNTDPLTLKLSLREKCAYGMGDFGSNLMLCIGTLYLLKFYTDELGMPAFYGGIIFLVAKFFTAFTDMLTGVLLDSRRNIGARGKFRPFILYASVPVALVATAQFMANDFSLTVKTALATVLFMMFGLCYSLMNCAYGAMVPAITKNPNERAACGVASGRRYGGAVALHRRFYAHSGAVRPPALTRLSGGRAGVRYRRPVLHVVVLQRGERTLRRAYARSP